MRIRCSVIRSAWPWNWRLRAGTSAYDAMMTDVRVRNSTILTGVLMFDAPGGADAKRAAWAYGALGCAWKAFWGRARPLGLGQRAGAMGGSYGSHADAARQLATGGAHRKRLRFRSNVQSWAASAMDGDVNQRKRRLSSAALPRAIPAHDPNASNGAHHRGKSALSAVSFDDLIQHIEPVSLPVICAIASRFPPRLALTLSIRPMAASCVLSAWPCAPPYRLD